MLLAFCGAPASSEQGPAERGAGTRLRDATAEPAVGASVIPAPCASPGSDPKGSPLPPCDAPRLRDANVRESGAALSSAGVASVSGVTSPKGAPVPPSDGALAAADQALPELVLEIQGHKLTAEVAATEPQRATGLMYRRMLPENRGMLFVFPYAAPQSFWMMNTYVPLSIAFLDEHGTIVNIADMKPLTTDSHNSTKPAKYALEMNLGWFAKRGIKHGVRVEGLKRAPAPR